jgi:hypothetical protein
MRQKEHLVAALEDIAGRIRELEEEAMSCLQEPSDGELYRRIQRKKAELLADLPDQLGELTTALSAWHFEALQTALEEIAEDARMAIKVDSPFYMSLLLYSEEQGEGEANDLQKLIAWLRCEAFTS